MVNAWAIMALESEAPALATHARVAVSGLGKINAAIAATRIILQHSPDIVINVGTAGGVTVGPGLHQPQRFVQRDMRCEALGYGRGATPFESEPAMIELGPGLICSTGDDFVTQGADLADLCDLVDMEAYAIAKVCQRFGVGFACWKWVSDQADHDSPEHWQQQVAAGEQHFFNALLPYGF